MTPAGFPHSDISGSTPACDSPKLFAANHVLHRLLTPRHSPCALSSLITNLLPNSANDLSQRMLVHRYFLCRDTPSTRSRSLRSLQKSLDSPLTLDCESLRACDSNDLVLKTRFRVVCLLFDFQRSSSKVVSTFDEGRESYIGFAAFVKSRSLALAGGA